MIFLSSDTSSWWIFIIVAIFLIIGVVVFILRKKIPGLVNYEDQDEETIANDNLSRILMDAETPTEETEVNDETLEEVKEEIKEESNENGEEN